MTDLLKNTPQHSEEAERAVLGAVLLDNEALDYVTERTKPQDFYTPRFATVFQSMLDVKAKGKALDTVTLLENLRSSGKLEAVGGPVELSSLTDAVPSSANAAYYARIIHEHALSRRLSQVLAECCRDSYERQDSFEAAAEAIERRVFEATQQRVKADGHTLPEQLAEAFARIYEPLNNAKYGIYDLDEMTHGLHPGQLVLIAARPSMGKTTMALNVIRNVLMDLSRGGGAVAFFSLEMPASDVLLNMCCSLAKVDTHDVRGRRLNEHQVSLMENASNTLSACQGRFNLVDDCLSTVGKIQAKCRLLKRAKALDMVVVDYLQIVQPPEGTPKGKARHEVVADIAQGLKNTARELGVPVLALAQLNREVEGRTDHKPRMSDLRESGAIEAVADTIILLHRESYYETDEEKREATENQATAIVAKNRNGPTGEVSMYYNAKYALFGGKA